MTALYNSSAQEKNAISIWATARFVGVYGRRDSGCKQWSKSCYKFPVQDLWQTQSFVAFLIDPPVTFLYSVYVRIGFI